MTGQNSPPCSAARWWQHKWIQLTTAEMRGKINRKNCRSQAHADASCSTWWNSAIQNVVSIYSFHWARKLWKLVITIRNPFCSGNTGLSLSGKILSSLKPYLLQESPDPSRMFYTYSSYFLLWKYCHLEGNSTCWKSFCLQSNWHRLRKSRWSPKGEPVQLSCSLLQQYFACCI